MKLDLSEIAATFGRKFEYKVNEDCGEAEDIRCVEPAVGSVEFTNTGNLIVARGNLSATIELDCSRCLEQFKLPVEVKVEEDFPIPNLQAVIAGQKEEIAEEEQEPLFEDNIFDLSEFVRQTILVQVPIKPLCSETCKGLCPTCGKNLNEGSCDCPVEVEDSPFAVLKEILKESKRSKE